MTTAEVLNAEGEFTAGALLSGAEQSAAEKLTDALKQELAAEGEAASVASAFVAGMVGGEAALAALAGGEGVMAAAGAGIAAATAAEASTAAALATGPLAPLTVAAFALPELLVAVWGASGGAGCCGTPPDPRPWPLIGGVAVPPSADPFKTAKSYETKAQAAARAVAQAKSANANASCEGNTTYEALYGKYPAPPKGSFQEYAYALVREAIERGELFKCWPIAQVNWAKLVALALASWNGTHGGPTARVAVKLGAGAGKDPLTYAVGQAVPPDGTKTVPTGQSTGFTETTIPTWRGQTSRTVFLRVNTGPAPHLRPIKMQPPKPKATAVPKLKTIGIAHAAPATAAPSEAKVATGIGVGGLALGGIAVAAGMPVVGAFVAAGGGLLALLTFLRRRRT